MPLQGPLVVVTEEPAPDLVEALAAAEAFPVVESRWADITAAMIAIQPAAIVLAQSGQAPDPEAARQLDLQLRTHNGPMIPVIACTNPGAGTALPDALPVDAAAPAARLIARLRSALRVRALDATVLRRAETFAEQTGRLVEFPDSDPLDDATVLVAGRGGSYPGLTVAVGERVGLIGALSIETAARYLTARGIDGIVIGDGFSPLVIDAFLMALGEDARFRELPIGVIPANAELEPHYDRLANLERVETHNVADWMLPLVRLHAFEARLKRMLASLDAQGMIDPATGLMASDAFWCELARAVTEANDRGVGLCIARFAFDPRIERRVSFDAARLIGGMVRNIDFACRDPDGAVLIVFTDTELSWAHIVARRIASALRATTLANGVRRPEPAITLATLKSSDTLETLVTRVGGRAVAAA